MYDRIVDYFRLDRIISITFDSVPHIFINYIILYCRSYIAICKISIVGNDLYANAVIMNGVICNL